MEKKITRRDFIKTAGFATVFTLSATQFMGCGTDEEEDLPDGVESTANGYRIDLSVDRFSELNTDGGFVNVPELEIMMANIDGRNIRAFHNECPFDELNDAWIYLDGRFRCTGCDSQYSNSGERVSGPAQSDLIPLDVTAENSHIIVARPANS